MKYSYFIFRLNIIKTIFILLFPVYHSLFGTIRLVSPENNASVTITNTKIQDWWDHYEKNQAVKMARKEEFCRPEPVLLCWTLDSSSDGSHGHKYDIYLSTHPDFKNAKVFHTRKNYLKVYNLFRGTKYYWKVTGRKSGNSCTSMTNVFYTKDCARTIRIKGAYNTRDIGGYRTSSGKKVRQGMVYRSGNFDSVKKEGKKVVQELGIRTQLDLRKPGEGMVGHKTLPVDNYIHLRGSSYKRILKSRKRRDKVAKLMRVFTDKNNYPVVFHCIYGRDRTGTLSFLLNGMLGVSKKDLYRDYELTFLSKHSSSVPKSKMRQFNKLYHKMSCYKDPSRSLEYNIEAFLLDIGLTRKELNTIEKIMLEN